MMPSGVFSMFTLDPCFDPQHRGRWLVGLNDRDPSRAHMIRQIEPSVANASWSATLESQQIRIALPSHDVRLGDSQPWQANQ